MDAGWIHRFSKLLLAFFLGIFCLIVGYNNIVDFNTNYQFVIHVLSMDSMQPWFLGTQLFDRAVTKPSLLLTAYWFIIALEIIAGLVISFGAFFMFKGARYDNASFSKGQGIFLAGATIALFIWYFSFAVVGSEWFQMWASTENAQMKAYTFSEFILLVMIYVIIPSPREWSES
ncbi:DUF2165 domain-containing protein [Parashewanella curva]|uniref:DUF2165 domain-containing protein n=1 Tax=Parashewanella curva TaxID=2338552 RepID=A0A3L8PTY3_9GAMM|nr:DUF2165 domain-containing protein [Parashewanella curva]RLV57868.1 DUF2165 domain-containing protein [Parashewanella curva]